MLAACQPDGRSDMATHPPDKPAAMISPSTLGPEFLKPGGDTLAAFCEASEQLQQQIEIFLQASPDSAEQQLQSLRKAWLDSHHHWQRAEYYLQAAAPELPPSLQAQINRLHSDTIQPGYIDSIAGYPNSGIVNDITLQIRPEVLLEQHQLFDPADVAIGLQALEFLLWGEKGQRTANDFGNRPSNAGNTEPDQRRSAYLEVSAQLLVEHCQALLSQWQSLSSLNSLRPHWRAAHQQLAALQAEQQQSASHSPYSGDRRWQAIALQNLQLYMDSGETKIDDEDRQRLLKHLQTSQNGLEAQLNSKKLTDKQHQQLQQSLQALSELLMDYGDS